MQGYEHSPLEQSLSLWYGQILIVKARDTDTGEQAMNDGA